MSSRPHSTNILRPPTPEILDIADLLDDVIGRFMPAAPETPTLGRYEADVEALNLFKLTVRHAEAVLSLAREDLVLLPPAMVITRSAFEATTRGLWLLAPTDLFQRELRWLAHLQEAETSYHKMAKLLDETAQPSGYYASTAQILTEFREGVTARLPAGYVPLKQLPNLREMLKSLGTERYYLWYQIASSYTHASQMGTEVYRRHWGTLKELGEFITLSHWQVCFRLCWFGLYTLGRRVLEVSQGKPEVYIPADIVDRIENALDAIGTRSLPNPG